MIAAEHVPDAVYAATRQHFTEKECADLTLAMAMLNSWNRLAMSFRAVPGTYQPEKAPVAQEGG
jgi:alkylhydroperoxidase family enzyme